MLPDFKSIFMRRIFLLLLFILISAYCHAQYHAAIGLRLGKFSSGLTMKYFANPDNATGFGLLLMKTKIGKKGGWWAAPHLVYQKPFEFPLLRIPLDFVACPGVHIGYYPEEYYKIVDGMPDYYPPKTVAIGLDLMIALEYQVPVESVPLVFGIDVYPFLEIVNKGPEFLDFGISVKYVFDTN
jgi:hypothetical protein